MDRFVMAHSRAITILPAQPDFENLSIDVLLEIMALLEWDDILRLRQVSMRLNLATHHRTIWYNLLKPSPARFTLRKRFDNCSSEDLEKSYLQVQLAHRRWVKPSVPRRVELLSGQDLTRPTTLLPGGRWLLMLTKNHELLYLDMDTPAAAWCSLIPPSMGDGILIRDRERTRSLSSFIDMDVDAEYLTFNIVIASLFENGGQQFFLPTRFTIWHVTTDFDDNGCATRLKATQLSVFEESRVHLKWNRIHLRGDFIAYHDRFPVIVNWRMANGCTDNFLHYCIHSGRSEIRWLYILPKNQVICGGGGYPDWVIVGWDSIVPITYVPHWIEFRHSPRLTLAQVSISVSEPRRYMRLLTRSDPPFISGNHVYSISDDVDEKGITIFRISFKLPDPATPAPFLVKEDVLCKLSTPRVPYTCTSTCGLLQSNGTITTTTNHIPRDGSFRAFDMFSWDGLLPRNLATVNAMMIDEISRRSIFMCPSVGERYVIEF